MAQGARASISTRCFTTRRKPRAACWRQRRKAPSSISPRCSVSPSPRAPSPTPPPRPRVVQVTKALAVELAFKGVRVNAIAPGWFVTEMNDEYLLSEAGDAIKREIPMGRFGNAGDLDGALLLLASDAGSYITGATIVVDGGQVVQIQGVRGVHGLHAFSRDRSPPPARARLHREARAAARSRSGEFLRAREHPARTRLAPVRAKAKKAGLWAPQSPKEYRRHGTADRGLGGDLRGGRALDLRPARHQLHGARRRQHEHARRVGTPGAEGQMAAARSSTARCARPSP